MIIRKLNALETLGATTNVCSDKTGTLTEGKMASRELFLCGTGHVYGVTGSGLSPEDGDLVLIDTLWAADGSTLHTNSKDAGHGLHPAGIAPEAKLTRDAPLPPAVLDALLGCALNNNATVHHDEAEGKWVSAGDQTEVALVVLARKLGIDKDQLLAADAHQFVYEMPFDSVLKRMSSVYRSKATGEATLYTKGALESVLSVCDAVLLPGGQAERLSDRRREAVTQIMTRLASQGLRVLGLAARTCPGLTEASLQGRQLQEVRPELEVGLTLVGLVGILDPPRQETLAAVESCHAAGIVVHMATGDHPATATAIAKMVAILPNVPRVPYGMVMHATEFDRLSDAEVDALRQLPRVVARCSPETKTKLIRALHRRNRRVAMTGDGVNDAPALKLADVGVAMGLNGSDVTKQVAGELLVLAASTGTLRWLFL